MLRSLAIAVTMAQVVSAADASLLALPNWRIVRTNEGFKLAHADRTIAPFALFSDGGTPKLLSCEAAKEDARIGLLTYYSGSAGTSQIYDITRVVVIDLRRKQILGIVLKNRTPSDDAPVQRQPEWIWGSGRLTVRDRAYGGETTLTW